MKLAVKNLAPDIESLSSLGTVSFNQDVIYWVQDLATAYYYCSQGKSSIGDFYTEGQPTPEVIRPNDKGNEDDFGVWVRDDYAVLPYLVADDYNFNANGATDLGFDTGIIENERFLGVDYDPSLQDIAELNELIDGQATYSVLGKESACPPDVTPTSISVSIGGTQNIIITGSGFSSNLSYCFNGGGAIILQATVLSDSITLEVDTTNVIAGNYELYLITGSTQNILAANVQFSEIPSGPLKFLRITSSFNSYMGVAFAKNSRGSRYLPPNLFDNNTGTRHQPDRYDFADHFAGIIMEQPTLVTIFSIYKVGSCDDFRLEGSNDTTTGLDGSWQTIQEFFNIKTNYYLTIEGNPVFLAFRIVWLTDNPNNGAREVYLIGKQ